MKFWPCRCILLFFSNVRWSRDKLPSVHHLLLCTERLNCRSVLQEAVYDAAEAAAMPVTNHLPAEV